jgi:hypothetical protein
MISNTYVCSCCNPNVGLATKARACKGVGQEWSSIVTFHALGNVRECEGMSSHFGSWTLDGLSNLQNMITRVKTHWIVRFLISLEIFLERKCLKWARMTHLNDWNTSYAQKKGQKSNWQFESRPLKVGNRTDLLTCRWHATYRWKVFNNFVWDLTSIGSLYTKLWVSKVVGVPFGNLGTKWHLGGGLMARHTIYYKGEGDGLPQVRAVVSLVNPCLHVSHLCTKGALAIRAW